MPVTANGGNALHELARAMAAGGRHSAAVALRKLAHAGYSTLEQVENTPDWILLAIRGIGVGRLGEVRRLSRPDWQPPSPQAIQAGIWFLSAAQFALHYWPLDTLASLVRGSTLAKVSVGPVEQRLALDVFSQAVRKARCYCEADELVQALWPATDGQVQSFRLAHDSRSGYDSRIRAWEHEQAETPGPDLLDMLPVESDPAQDSDRFAHPRHKRFEIVQDYWTARERGEVQNKDAWARCRYHISSKTLLSYEREFSGMKQAVG